MILKRLTKIQKDEIVEAYRGGEDTNTLAEKYGCSSNTINRTVKTLLSDIEFKLLKEKRLKSSNKKAKLVKGKTFNGKQKDFEDLNCFNFSQEEVKEEEQTITNDNSLSSSQFEEIAYLSIGDTSPADLNNNENLDIKKTTKEPDNEFELIAPLSSSFDFEKKELDFEIYNQESLPESVYMLVDKKVELEVKAISDLPEWSFLPENELTRNALILFSNQRAAKRSCSKNQRVIKIPDTNVFEVSKSYLILKGITRLIIDELIIALDN